jgi:hypothetical protein
LEKIQGIMDKMVRGGDIGRELMFDQDEIES